ncbi:hypothetical protein NKG94_03890 [Micromonospora sp. M12]
MGLELWDSSPVFAAEMRACEDALRPHTGWSLRRCWPVRWTGSTWCNRRCSR